MRTRTKRQIVEHSQLRKMLSYHSCYKNKSEQQSIKNSLKDEIIAAYGDKWIRLAEGTRSAIDESIFMGTEKGFSFMSKDYLTRHGISKRTLDRAFNFLAEKGLIYIAYRRKGYLNLTGKPIYLFTSHPYFSYWIDFLSLDVAGIDAANVAAKNSQTSSLASDSIENEVSTISLPEQLSKNTCIKDRSEGIDTVPDNIDHNFAKLYSCYFGVDVKAINDLWTICKHQAWKQNIDAEHITQGAIHALKQTVGQMKIKRIRNVAAYFTATIKAIYHDIFISECYDKFGVDMTQEFEFSMPYD